MNRPNLIEPGYGRLAGAGRSGFAHNFRDIDAIIDNLYFVGAGTHPGAGVPGVIGSAKATAGLMIQDMA